MDELPVGTVLSGGRYRIVRCLGVGGFGITYEVVEVRPGGGERVVAVKELFPSLDGDRCRRSASGNVVAPAGTEVVFDELRASTLREAQTLAGLVVPGVVRVFDFFEEHATAYIVMEFVEGRPLRDLLGVPWDDIAARRLVAQLAKIVGELHANHVVHRDLTPSNVILDGDDRPTIIDFGLARGLSTSQTSWSGTRGYGAPEQFGMVPGEVTSAADVFALAVLAGEVFTGRRPNDVPPLEAKPDLDPAVASAIVHGSALRPEERPRTVDQFLLELSGRGSSSAPTPPGAVPLSAMDSYPSSDFSTIVPRPPDAQPEPDQDPPSGGSRRPIGLMLTAVALGIVALLIVAVIVFAPDDPTDLTAAPTTTTLPGSTTTVSIPAQPVSLAESVNALNGTCGPGSKKGDLSFRGSPLDTNDMWGCGSPGTSASGTQDAALRVPLGGNYHTVTLTMGACDQDRNGDDTLTVRTSSGMEQIRAISLAAPIIDDIIDVAGSEYLELTTEFTYGGCFVLASITGLPA